jgi:hypothetical protein
MGIQSFDEHSVVNVVQIIDNALGLGLGAPYTFVGQGGIINRVIATNSDTIDHVVVLNLFVNFIATRIGSVHVPAGAGYGGVASVDVLDAVVPGTVKTLRCPTDVQIQVGVEVIVGATKQVAVYFEIGVF